MKVNVYIKPYETKLEKRYLLIIRRNGQRDECMNLGPIKRKEAEQTRVKVLSRLLSGTFQKTSLERITLAEFCRKFLVEYLSGQVAESTFALYKDRLCQVCDAFGAYYLDQITQKDIEIYLSQKEWAPRSKNILLSCLRNVFQKAIEWSYLNSSPLHGIKRWKENSCGSRALTQNEISQLLSIATPWQLSVLTVLMYTGMRSGELSRFKFQDIDWEARQLTIVSDKERKTKSRKKRIIPMSEDLEKTLKFLQNHWPNLQYGSGGEGILPHLPREDRQKEYVFCHRDGRPVRSFRKSFNNLMDAAKIKGVTLHGVRKTFCSLLARNKVHVKVAQILMGHTDPRLTLEIYTEIDDGQLRDAVNLLPSTSELQKKKLLVMEGMKSPLVESSWNKTGMMQLVKDTSSCF